MRAASWTAPLADGRAAVIAIVDGTDEVVLAMPDEPPIRFASGDAMRIALGLQHAAIAAGQRRAARGPGRPVPESGTAEMRVVVERLRGEETGNG